ncbi:hypothetical protein GCM10009850_040570 [Nonomuraea monospora]|uniref:DUF3800 domain-containing protein n=1 Tax=Nonomuraea monospora TaxID=568818 RepID=A0ABN3CGR7_9ACTN
MLFKLFGDEGPNLKSRANTALHIIDMRIQEEQLALFEKVHHFMSGPALRTRLPPLNAEKRRAHSNGFERYATHDPSVAAPSPYASRISTKTRTPCFDCTS